MLPLIYHPIYSLLPLPEGHRYPIMKYQYLYDAIVENMQNDSYWQQKIAFFSPQALSFRDIKLVHDEAYVDLLASGQLPAHKMRRIGFPWSEALMQRTLTSAAGTVLTAHKAIESGIAIHLSGGYHHAHKDFGSGFCLFNDLVLAAHFALQKEDIEKVLIIDSDVHHGDGTATLCQGRDDIITLSFHCDKNFPARKPDSDLDVPLTRGTGDEAFLVTFKQVVKMAIRLHRPDLVIYDAGVDLHQDDELGYLNISTQAIYQRDLFLLQTVQDNQIPVAAVVGGGYRTEQKELVPVHFQLIQAALDLGLDLNLDLLKN
ncbi:deacetylase, histone deacetylase/acetoin utilization protein [Shewanella psychrophila]|uniref:Deacetylase, histone deacetylase/acetoin utilization protein n=1 Tax=Shewanella psychrophila TaxID=225848 RepID=A0A1S6HQT8_9GAMM|nr:histone deacetylase [Shewanella psychrophila]AQS37896.1 deacetylase, histone deacetylase/acetoin utilization protein [Shewanella psychrophila]